MKGNSIVKNVILVMIITSVMIFALSFRAVYAALDLNSGGFESIGSGSNDGNIEPDPTPAVATPKNNVVENNIIQNNTTNKSSSSANESQLPATGSNTEIIFAVGAAALVGIVAVIYKKANIKIN